MSPEFPQKPVEKGVDSPSPEKRERARILSLSMIAALASYLAACAPEHGPSELTSSEQDSMSYEQSSDITLQSGRTITLPDIPGFEREPTMLSRNQSPEKVVLLFPQEHWSSKEELAALSQEERERRFRGLVDSQGEIYAGMRDLVGKGLLNKVCMEGFRSQAEVDDILAEYTSNFDVYTLQRYAEYWPQSDAPAAIAEYRQIASDGVTTAEEQPALRSIKDYAHRVAERYGVIMGAPMVLAVEGRVEMCPGDSGEAIQEVTADPEIRGLIGTRLSSPQHERA